MAVRIRLKKMGRKHRPFFRVCAMDQRSPRDGRVIEELGTYDPMVPDTDARTILKADRIDYWLSVGAQPTPKVGVLIRKYGTEGSHLEAQQKAIASLSGRRANTIELAKAAAAAVKMQRSKPSLLRKKRQLNLPKPLLKQLKNRPQKQQPKWLKHPQLKHPQLKQHPQKKNQQKKLPQKKNLNRSSLDFKTSKDSVSIPRQSLFCC